MCSRLVVVSSQMLVSMRFPFQVFHHGEPTVSEVNPCMQECSPKALLSTACTLSLKLLFGSSHCGSSSFLMCIPELELSADLLFFTSCSHVQPCRSRSRFAANSCGLIKTMIPDEVLTVSTRAAPVVAQAIFGKSF